MNNPFNIIQDLHAEEYHELDQSRDLNDRIKTIIESGDIVLFMKGNAQMPQCGFSANTIKMLETCQKKYKTFNILMSEDIRQGLKTYSNWPTFPQLYVKGKLIGGNDIISELFEEGELQKMLNDL